MSQTPENIHPIFDQLLGREDKEQQLQQRAKVVWFTGLSGSGKSTIARVLEYELYAMGFLTQVIDGDNVRAGINNNLGFSEADRLENIRRVAEVSKLFLDCGIITLNCFVSPTEDLRQLAKQVIGEADFIEVYVNAPFEVCEQRDVKGLYQKARKGEIKNFTGLDAPFEAPVNADLELHTDRQSIEESARQVLDFILPKIKYEAVHGLSSEPSEGT
ncbi:MAG: adenylyl-sulfate kinase [Chitinophagales bacterium]|nr:adenylyl-sulfate kinase [Chitinophagales bacterium]